MIDTLLTLVPEYGLIVVFTCVALSCLALPLPSSMLIMASGGFAAAGDLVLWHVILAAGLGFAVGDQVAYIFARWAGPPLIDRLRAKPRLAPMITKTETTLNNRGAAAIVLSRTILSPTAPYVSYLCGAARLKWHRFTFPALLGAGCWVMGYAFVGYIFADQMAQVAAAISDVLGLIIGLTVLAVLMWWLRHRWKLHVATEIAAAATMAEHTPTKPANA